MALSKKWNAKLSLRGSFAAAAISSLLILAACGGDSSSSGPTDNGSSEVVAVKDKSISGVSQKGPFVTGSAVTLYELDGKTYASTGKSFPGKIASDDGKFSVSSVNLASQYALLKADGYFRNEITGNKSKGPITLYALTDLSDREKVNINLLTHLEYDRALYLVNTGVDLLSAKKQAETEILNAFGIKGEFANSEDLDIFSDGEGNAALLAFSVLMLGGLEDEFQETDVAELTERLTKFALDIEMDGIWDDEETKTKIADWVAETNDWNGWGRLANVRGNIEKWGLGMVPEFEKYVRNFWYTNYGLGECGSNNKAEVLATKNERSAKYGSQTRYICKDGVWVDATDVEKDFYQSGKDNGGDGELWTGLVTGQTYKYDEFQKTWIVATHNDTTLKLKGCSTNRTGEIVKSSIDDTYYVCKNMEWQVAKEIDHDTYGEICTSKEVGKKIDGVVTVNNKYYCTADGWVSLLGAWSWDVPKSARLNSEIAYGSITDSRDGQTYKTTKIGEQVWMAENLNYADSTKTPSLLKRNWCFNNELENCAVTGRLYTWAAAIDSVALYDGGNGVDCGYGKTCMLPTKVQGICPDGWHLPTKAEWETLFTEVGGQSIAGKVLRSQTGWYNNGMDGVGFSALPAGERHYDGTFLDDGYHGNFWNTTEGNIHVLLDEKGDDVWVSDWVKNFGFSVRCLQD